MPLALRRNGISECRMYFVTCILQSKIEVKTHSHTGGLRKFTLQKFTDKTLLREAFLALSPRQDISILAILPGLRNHGKRGRKTVRAMGTG